MKLATFQSPSLENIYQAAQIIGDRAADTPCRYSRQLSAMTGTTVILKL